MLGKLEEMFALFSDRVEPSSSLPVYQSDLPEEPLRLQKPDPKLLVSRNPLSKEK
jgi:hypothetical protein